MVYQDDSQTLPSVEAPGDGARGAQELLLTILFHPDTSRIGQRVVVPMNRRSKDCILGRFTPEFKSPDHDASQEAHCLAEDSPDRWTLDSTCHADVAPYADGSPHAVASCHSADTNQTAAPLDDPYISRRVLQLKFNGGKVRISRIAGSSRCRVASSELMDEVEVDLKQLEQGVPMMLSHRIVLMLKLGGRQRPGGLSSQFSCALIGSGDQMTELRRRIQAAAECNLDVLIRGETGSGKELVADAIHYSSARADNPLISVNMAAVSAELAAAALFGAARGAYTGADQASPGYFRQAQGGTLFLDEIGAAHTSVQPQLLRVLQEREIQAVGGKIEQVDVRVISATDAAIEEDGSGFNSALRHRLAALEIAVPPLREHAEDTGELLLHFLQEASAELGLDECLPHPEMEAVRVAEWANAFCLFANYDWPGNVRQLRNLARQLLMGSQFGALIDENLRATLVAGSSAQPTGRVKAARPKMRDIPEGSFDEAMLKCRYEPKAVAVYLGVSRTAVYRRIESSSRYQLATQLAAELIEQTLAQQEGSVEKAAEYLQVSQAGLRRRLQKLRAISN